MIRGLASKILNKVKELVLPARGVVEDARFTKLMAQSLVWATAEHTDVLGTNARTVDWGYQWVIHHLMRESLADKVLVDLGSGVLNPVIVYYSERVRHAYLLDLFNTANPIKRGTVLQCDLEKPLPFPDASVDLVISTSVLEHLTAEGRLLQAREVDRILRPGGKAFLTMSYLFGLDANTLDVLGREPWLNEHGNTVKAPLDVAAMIEQMPHLRPLGESDPTMFPGFEGFDEVRVLEIPRLLTHAIVDSDWGTFTPETNALGIEWAEVGMALGKPHLGDTDMVPTATQQTATGVGGAARGEPLARLRAPSPAMRRKGILVTADRDLDAASVSAFKPTRPASQSRRRSVRGFVRTLTKHVWSFEQTRTTDADRRVDAPALVHVHIPKCAGNTFNRILSLTFGDRHQNWYSEDPFFVFEPEEIAARLEANPEITSMASHSIRSFPPRLANRPMLYVTFLRNPLDRFVSYITFLKKNEMSLTETHRLYVPADCGQMTVRDIAQWLVANEREVPFKSNPTVHFLSVIVFRNCTAALSELLNGNETLPTALRDVYERFAADIASAVLDRMFFVGIVEEMERSVALLSERLTPHGLALNVDAFQRENVSADLRGDMSWLNESDEVGHRVLESFDKDVVLYRRFKERLLR